MESDHGHGHDNDVKLVLDRESKELFHIISGQNPIILMTLLEMMPQDATLDIGELSDSGTAANYINMMLRYFSQAEPEICSRFLQRVCMLCENIPMHLESALMSVAGYNTFDALPFPTTEELSIVKTVDDLPSPTTEELSRVKSDASVISSVSIPAEKSLSPSSEQQLIKRRKIATDYLGQYIAAVMNLLLKRWEQLTKCLVTEVHLENVWVKLHTSSRHREKPDQTPASAERGSQPYDSDYGFMETRVTLEKFLQGCTGQLTVLLGQSGSGKSLLMSYLGQLWARGLGPIPSSYLFILLEFRQLRLLTKPLSLFELLFQHHLPLGGENDETRGAILDFIISSPELICWVLDGYDEFNSKLTNKASLKEVMDPDESLPVADLISGLLYRQLLPGCTVIVTCRERDKGDLEGISDQQGLLQGWDRHEIKNYVENFFQGKGNGRQAADLLLSNQHLVAMSSNPALCNICCICVEYLLLDDKVAKVKSRDEGKQSENDTKAQITENDVKEPKNPEGIREGKGMETAKLPSTVTQVYLCLLAAFLCRDHDSGNTAKINSGNLSQSNLLTMLGKYQSEVCELSRLAWRGLEEHKLLFPEGDIHPDVLAFSVRIGLFSEVELKLGNGKVVIAYSFVHQSLQEFMASLHVMISKDIKDIQLKQRFTLTTRWTTKLEQKTVFSDSVQLYVCGLASAHCTSFLIQLASISPGYENQLWVSRRQDLFLKQLKGLCQSTALTGPKILKLCHCVQESQDHKLASHIVGTRSTLELYNITLLPKDIIALAFVAQAVGNNSFGLSFGACTMDRECLNLLPNCHNIHSLSFRNRKCNDKFMKYLAPILPLFKKLRKLEFCGSSLSASGAAILASALQNCSDITEINLTSNNMRDKGIKHITEVFTRLPRLLSVKLGGNKTSLMTVYHLINNMSSYNIQHIHVDGNRELRLSFHERCDNKNLDESVSLLNQKWTLLDLERLVKSLAQCSVLSVLDLSGSEWDFKTLRTLTNFFPKLRINKQIIMNKCCFAVEHLLILTALLSKCPSVKELHVRLQSPAEVSIMFSEDRQQPGSELSKILCVNCCDLLPADMDRVWSSLTTPSDIRVLDLSNNMLENKGLMKLLTFLKELSRIEEINVSRNDISMEGVLMLAGALCNHSSLTQIDISDRGRDQVILKFCPNKSDNTLQLKIFRVNYSSLLPSEIMMLCQTLVPCHCHLELDFSYSTLKDEAMETPTNNVNVLLQRLNFTHCSLNSNNIERLLHILQHGPQLSYFDISSNQLEDKGVKSLMDSLPKLQIAGYMNLSNNKLSQRGLFDVASKMCAYDNVSGVEVCLEAEETCVVWFGQKGGCEKTLSIRESCLQNSHLDILAQILCHCPSLSKLKLKKNLLRKDQIIYFVQHLNSIRSEKGRVVSIEETWIQSAEAVSLVCSCLDSNTKIQAIRVHRTTLYLTLINPSAQTSFCDSAADKARLMVLKKIGLVDCGVTGHHVACLRGVIERCRFITELDFSDNNLDAEGAEFIHSILPLLSHLTSLSISGDFRNETTISTLIKSLPHLESVNFSHCTWSAVGGLQLVKALRRCFSLSCLCLDSMHLDEDSRVYLAEALRKIHSIHCLKLNNISEVTETGVMLDLLAAMDGLKQIEEIELERWKMADTGVERLIRLIPVWTELKKISLSTNLIRDQMGDKLMQALSSSSYLQELSLRRNSLGNDTAARMALVLPSLTHLAVLDISENSIGYEGSMSLSKAIMGMKNLSKIYLTSVGTSKLCAVVASLSSCTQLQDIGLGWNNCDDDVALELARIMLFCQKLTRIDLESNCVTTRGAEALIRALQTCPSLELIRLWRNKMSSSEAEKLSLLNRRLNFSST